MNGHLRIGEVSAKYGVSNRTLRYYEEVGLLKSFRDPDSKYRYYDKEACKRLEMIIFFRNLQLTIKEIKAIFTGNAADEMIRIFTSRYRSLEEEQRLLENLRHTVKSILEYTLNNGHNGFSIPELVQDIGFHLTENEIEFKEREEKPMSSKLSDVRIIELKPFNVAYYRAISESPELDAWKVMFDWLKNTGILNSPTTRFFGFNNPNPSPDKAEYGYEVWVTVPEGFETGGEIKTKNFEGGLYAVSSSYLYEISEKWMQLVEWVKESDYQFGEHQCLEETISPNKIPDANTQFDLFCPVVSK
ncbi:MerR family transcriptional regulator [Kosmotoga pacifica]|uniref:HTH merR-type domain-containing protein n=1 Tax=Kosmotoga pacifica TaxID=1330330 RepID=A0A0G2ZEZ1_9BACT|nr:MerR family transcriptional regulator [Kosmotoga pacifica]AKI97398.1 hypothetical protein IX53_05715 [Kosmotoga pacifica]